MTDYSIYADLLARLQAATSEEEKGWMLMEFSLNQLPPTVREAVWAAAIPHQFDRELLGTLLTGHPKPSRDFKQAKKKSKKHFYGLSDDEFNLLLQQSYLEHLWDGGYAVHESTRKLLLAKLYQDDPQRYYELNRRAANYCEQQNQEELRWRVATLYHQVLANLDGVTDKFNSQTVDWWNNFQWNKLEALIFPLLEEVKAQRLKMQITARIYFWQGVLDTFYSHPFLAKEYLKQALLLYQQVGDNLGKINCIKSLGDLHLSLSEFEAASEAYQQALPLYQQIGSKLGTANCIRGLGDVSLSLSEFETARGSYQQALPLYKQIGAKLGEANCIRRLGDIHLSLSEFKAAHEAYQQALLLYQQIGDKTDKINDISNLYKMTSKTI